MPIYCTHRRAKYNTFIQQYCCSHSRKRCATAMTGVIVFFFFALRFSGASYFLVDFMVRKQLFYTTAGANRHCFIYGRIQTVCATIIILLCAQKANLLFYLLPIIVSFNYHIIMYLPRHEFPFDYYTWARIAKVLLFYFIQHFVVVYWLLWMTFHIIQAYVQWPAAVHR